MSAQAILIVGESGTGKSTSAENLPAEETFYINVASKDLPYRGWKKRYTELSKDNPTGNLLNTTDSSIILNTLDYINSKRPEIKYVIIDDGQYVSADYLMSKAKDPGYGKFTDAALIIYKLATKNRSLRGDLILFILTHSETDTESGRTKAKTSGEVILPKPI